eukprot:7177099-Lingulodinium_polyedra.AAC.1
MAQLVDLAIAAPGKWRGTVLRALNDAAKQRADGDRHTSWFRQLTRSMVAAGKPGLIEQAPAP